jgi:nitroreductase
MPTIEFTGRGPAGRGGLASALARAAVAARRAPSVLDSQPWRWRISEDLAELRADRADRADRAGRLPTVGRYGRLLVISCGAALDHAVTALAGAGAQVKVEALPDPGDLDLLARLYVTGFGPVHPEAVRRHRAIALRRTDRCPLAEAEVPEPALRRLRDSAEQSGAHLHLLPPADVVDLTVALSRAAGPQPADPHHRTDRYARYAVLLTDHDTPTGWLAAGQALSAVLLTATLDRLAAFPISNVTEAPATRRQPRTLPGGTRHPMLTLRIGIPAESNPPPGRPAAGILDLDYFHVPR